mgnify:CR=1 FL=1
MRIHYPDPSLLHVILLAEPERPWALYSDNPEWVKLSIRKTGIVARFPTRTAAQDWLDDKRRRLPLIQERSCGNCRACCTPLGITELNKAPGIPCRHLVKGDCGGCGIYETRPLECREYFCGWRCGIGDLNQRPDHSGVLLTPRENRADIIEGLPEISFVAHEVWRKAFRRPAAVDLMTDVASRGFIVFAIHGPELERCQVMGPEDLVYEAAQWCKRNGYKQLLGILAEMP